MGSGQMMITIGALFLLSLVVLRVYNGFLNTNSVLLDSKLGVLATSIAASVVEESTGKAFDENTDSTSVSNLSDLSSTLGPETGETYPNFDDFDDYDGLKRMDTSIPAADFEVECKVDYVTDSNLDGSTTSRTWNKKITVFVTSPSMYDIDGKMDTIVMSAIYSYWYFR